MGKGSRPQRILWRSIWANYFPALIPFHFLCEGNNFTLLPTSLSTNMCDQRIILAEKNKTALNMILFHTGYTDWVTIRYLRQKRPKKSVVRESSLLYPSPMLMKNLCVRRVLFLLRKNRTALKMILFHWLHLLSHNYIFKTKKTKKSLARESSVLYPSPLLMKNSSQLHLHSGKKLMAFGYKWTGKKAFLLSLFLGGLVRY